jgi:phytoene dehydrogenase-like protein
MADYDVIVVGGGIGGLSIGALMAKDGRKTLVLEQNKRIGGFCSTNGVGGYRGGPYKETRINETGRRKG